MAGPGPSQYVVPQGQATALTGSLPHAFYGIQQPVLYSPEDLQLIQQRLPVQGQMSVPVTRDGLAHPGTLYTVPMSDATKYRADGIPAISSAMTATQQQYAAALASGGGVMTASVNPAMLPYYTYPSNVNTAYPSVYPHYGVAAPQLMQIPAQAPPPQYPGQKIIYGVPSSYYDSLPQEYKAAYIPNSLTQSKVVGGASVGTPSSGTDMSAYKSHLNKVNRQTYDRQSGIATGTPPPYNVTSATSPLTPSAYAPMIIPTMPAGAAAVAAAQHHHAPVMHHPIHQVIKPNTAIKF